jgi:histidine phosphotransferase ChpT
MNVDSLRLGELLCARLLHDLAGPVGALANGAELLGDDPDPDTVREAGALVAATAGQLVRRLRFFRAAFGWEGGAAADAKEAGRLLADHLAPLEGQPQAIELDWPANPPALPRLALKLALLLALVGSEGLARGGRLGVDLASDWVTITVRGPGAKLDSGLAAILKGEQEGDPSPRNAPGFLIRFLTNSVKGYLVVDESEDHIILRARFGAQE